MLDSPASSISSASFRYPKLQQDENGTITDLPSPASSTISPESSYSSENSKQLGISTGQQQDYFGLIASQPPNTTPIIPSSLQRGSPTLSPSLKSEQSSNSDDSLSDSNKENDNRSTCLLLESTPTSSLSPPSGLGPQAPTIAGKKNTKIRFTTTLRVHDTFGSKDYDRRCDTQVTCQRLTPVLALQIKQELNEYKLNEMVVHSSSRQYTQFFL
ncbi:hypothetical protein BC941DRAFT_449360 [Chlamydoabsidia padenii]|nr:hypothetical protein BC941DRAFT_449360 [Chlamydoabsidia padenii]